MGGKGLKGGGKRLFLKGEEDCVGIN